MVDEITEFVNVATKEDKAPGESNYGLSLLNILERL